MAKEIFELTRDHIELLRKSRLTLPRMPLIDSEEIKRLNLHTRTALQIVLSQENAQPGTYEKLAHRRDSWRKKAPAENDIPDATVSLVEHLERRAQLLEEADREIEKLADKTVALLPPKLRETFTGIFNPHDLFLKIYKASLTGCAFDTYLTNAKDYGFRDMTHGCTVFMKLKKPWEGIVDVKVLPTSSGILLELKLLI